MKKLVLEHAAITFVAVLCAFSYSIIIASAGFGDLGVGGSGPEAGDGKGGDNKAIYYFNNAVNSDPNEAGNYWHDAEATDPANEVPDSTASEVSILEGAEYNGDANFIGEASNSGTVTGDAFFIGDNSENYGDVAGTMIRLYNNEGSTNRDFTTNHKSWTVQADGVTLDITGATYDNDTTFVRSNGGLFISDFTLSTAEVNGQTITLQYNKTLNEDSVPLPHDYSLTVNGNNVTISDVHVGGSQVIVEADEKIPAGATALLNYTLGDNLVLSSQGLNGMGFEEVTLQVTTSESEEGSEPEPTPPSEISMSAPLTSVSSLSPSILFSKKVVRDAKEGAIIQEKLTPSTKADSTVKQTEKEKVQEKTITSGAVLTLPSLEQQAQPLVTTPDNNTTSSDSPSITTAEQAKVWYVPPAQNQRYEVSKGNALNLFRSTSLGITNKDLAQIPVAGSAASRTALGNRLVGRFLLQVENKGQTWYVNSNGYRAKVTADNVVEVTKQSAVSVNSTILETLPVAQGR